MKKRYWVQNIRTNEELVLDADNLSEVSKITGWSRRLIKINKVYRRKGKKSGLALLY